MFAIVQTGGKQYRVAKGDTLIVDRMDVEEGKKVELDNVLLIADKDVVLGSPTIEGAKVTAKVIGHHRGDKVITFKYRPRNRMRVRRGFRHSHTTLEITAIKG